MKQIKSKQTYETSYTQGKYTIELVYSKSENEGIQDIKVSIMHGTKKKVTRSYLLPMFPIAQNDDSDDDDDETEPLEQISVKFKTMQDFRNYVEMTVILINTVSQAQQIEMPKVLQKIYKQMALS